jgi:hypothetical protein
MLGGPVAAQLRDRGGQILLDDHRRRPQLALEDVLDELILRHTAALGDDAEQLARAFVVEADG